MSTTDIARPPARPEGRRRKDETPGSDSELVERAVRDLRAGRRTEAGFRVLLEVYHPVVRGFFAKRLSSGEECLDLTQETFLRVYKGVKGFRGESPFGAWLFRIAWNVLHRHRERRASRPANTTAPLEELEDRLDAGKAPDAPMLASAARDPLGTVLHREKAARLRRAVDRLPRQRRRCVLLWAYQELTYEQIAVALQLSLGTVKAHLAQARKQLQSLLLEDDEDKS